MSDNELAAVIIAVASVVGVGVLDVLAVSMQRTLKSMERAVDALVSEAVPVVNDLRSTVNQTNAELERVDGLLETAESISQTVDSASRLAYLAMSNPVIKTMAFASGTARMAKRLRKPDENGKQ